jgi:putative transposase
MPRQSRLILPEVAAHIVQRGNNRAACFRADGDYLLYLLHLKELATKLDCRVHAYCLMGNHVHLLVTPSSAGACMALMRNLGQRYVQHFNKIYGRTGTLWEGRYRSCVAESARYVLACYRYIELNPVRAGMVSHPASYPWSSYRGNTGGRSDPLVSPHPEFMALGLTAESRSKHYARLVEEALDASLVRDIRDATNGGYPLGSDAFKADVAKRGHKIEPGRAGRPTKQTPASDSSDREIGL